MTESRDRRCVIAAWWRANLGNRDSGRARALAARLRRATGVEALAEPEVHDLARRLGLHPGDAGRLALLATVLAEVRTEAPERLARRLGGPEPALSQLRFQRLLRARDEEFAAQLRRALPMADRRCDVGALGRDLLGWDHPERGDRIRADWCFDYFGAPRPGAGAADATVPEETSA